MVSWTFALPVELFPPKRKTGFEPATQSWIRSNPLVATVKFINSIEGESYREKFLACLPISPRRASSPTGLEPALLTEPDMKSEVTLYLLPSKFYFNERVVKVVG